MYLAEVAPRELRGTVAACNALGITLGDVVAYLATLSSTLNTNELWPIACGLCVVPAAISLLILPFCPESPRFLFMKKGDEIAARKAFCRLNSNENVEALVCELMEEMTSVKTKPQFRFTHLFTRKDLRMPVLLACILVMQQQFSGINAVISYSSTMLRTAGFHEQYIQYCVLAVGVLNILVTTTALLLLQHAGRRTLLLWPTLVLTLVLLLLTVTVNVSTDATSRSLQRTMGLASAILILVYVGAFSLGLGSVTALIVSELFRQEPRAAAFSLSQCLYWFSNLLILGTYPSIVVSGSLVYVKR
ncbi:unnamed protein product [Dicrocoelium dendriticum]|nr:unnamed protein product [Dicrocoelium dendriticum]